MSTRSNGKRPVDPSTRGERYILRLGIRWRRISSRRRTWHDDKGIWRKEALVGNLSQSPPLCRLLLGNMPLHRPGALQARADVLWRRSRRWRREEEEGGRGSRG